MNTLQKNRIYKFSYNGKKRLALVIDDRKCVRSGDLFTCWVFNNHGYRNFYKRLIKDLVDVTSKCVITDNTSNSKLLNNPELETFVKEDTLYAVRYEEKN